VKSSRDKFYDKTGNAVDNVKDYAGDLYDRAGNQLYRARETFYDKTGKAVDNVKDYAGDLYDKTGNVVHDARDRAYDAAHDAKERVGDAASHRGHQAADYVADKMHQAGDKLKQKAGTPEEKPTVWSSTKHWFGTLTKFLVTLGAILLSAYLLIRWMSRTSTEQTKKQVKELSETIKDKAGRAKEAVNDMRHKAKEVIDQKLSRVNEGRERDHSDSDHNRRRDNETTHEYNLRVTKAPVKHYGVDGDEQEEVNTEVYDEDTVVVDTTKHGRVVQK